MIDEKKVERRRAAFRATFARVWLFAVATAAVSLQAHPVKNSSFESTSGGFPVNWTLPYANGYESSNTNMARVYTGSRSIRINDTGSSAGDVGAVRSDPIPINGGRKYIASIRCWLASGTSVSFYLEYRNAAGTLLESHVQALTTLGSWQVITVVPEDATTKQLKAAPAGATNITLMVYSPVAQVGNSYFDNAVVTEVESVGITNDGFESISGSLPTDWSTPYGNGFESTSTARSYAGSRSVKIADTSGSLPGGVRSEPIPVIPGRKYAAKVKCYLESGTTATLYLEFWNVDGTRMLLYSEPITGTGSWQTVVVMPFESVTKAQIVAPYSVSYATVLAYSPAAQNGTVYFDVAELLVDDIDFVPGGVLADNAGFEEVDGAGFPIHWKKYGPNGYESGSTAQAHSGSRSVRINDTSASGYGGVESRPFPVVEGRSYRANIKAFLQSGEFSLYARYFDNESDLAPKSYTDDEYLSANATSISSTGSWQDLTLDFTPPFLAKYATLLIYSKTADIADGYFDSASVVALGEGISNGGFEEWSLGRYPHGWTGHLNSAAIVTTGSDYRSSEAARSLKIADTSASEGGGARSNRILGPDGTGIVNGVSYSASAQVYLESGVLDLYVEFWDSSGTRIGYNTATVSTTGSWQDVVVTDAAPSGTEYATVLLYSPVATSNTVAFVDRVEFRREVAAIGGRRQLFIDDFIVEDTNNVTRSFHAASKTDAVVAPSASVQENNTVFVYGSFLYDPQEPSANKYRLYYTADGYSRLAVSSDGLNWTKPILNNYTLPGGGNNNIIVATDQDNNLIGKVGISVAIDPNETDPAKRYKAFGRYYKETDQQWWYQTYFSADGLEFFNPVTHLNGWDVATMAYDETNQQFVGAVKYFDNVRRVHRIATSADAETWTVGVRAETLTDPLDTVGFLESDSYGLGWYPYEGVYIGFNWVFQIDEGLDAAPGQQDGEIIPQLVFTRDLSAGWTRPNPSRDPLIPRTGGTWEGVTYTASSALRVGDEVFLYYGAFNGGHGSSSGARIGLARWRLDGFASLDASATEGTVLTRPLTFTGSGLKVNVDAAGTGNYLKAELLDSSGNVIAGYSAAQCTPINADSVNATVSWTAGSDISALAGQTIQVRFYLKNAQLYALEFD